MLASSVNPRIPYHAWHRIIFDPWVEFNLILCKKMYLRNIFIIRIIFSLHFIEFVKCTLWIGYHYHCIFFYSVSAEVTDIPSIMI